MIETFFTEKGIIKKLIIAIVFVFLFNFSFGYLGNNIVFADDEKAQGEVMDDQQIMDEEGGGKLLLPIHSLLLFLADALLQTMQNSFVSSMPVTITATADQEKTVSAAKIIGIVIGVAVAVVACIVTWGAGAAVVGAVGAAASAATATAATVAGTIVTAVATYGGTFVGGLVFAGLAIGTVVGLTDSVIDDIKGEYKLPTIQYTPEEIFANRIPIFNINFFNPPEEVSINYDKIMLESTELDLYDEFDLTYSMMNFLRYIYDSDSLSKFKFATEIEPGENTEMHGKDGIPDDVKHLIKSEVLELRHNNNAGKDVYLNNEIVPVDFTDFYDGGSALTYFCVDDPHPNHVAACHFWLGDQNDKEYVYMLKYLEDGDNNRYEVYKYELSDEDKNNYFSENSLKNNYPDGYFLNTYLSLFKDVNQSEFIFMDSRNC